MQRVEIKRVTDRVSKMSSAVAEMSEIVRAAAEPWTPGDSVKAGINRAARALGFSPRRVTTLWYSRPAAVLAEEMDRARTWYRAHVEHEAARLETRAAELRARGAALGARINDQNLAMARQCGVHHG